MSDPTDVVGLCRKLLRLQRRASTAGEAHAAAHALTRLLDKHRLTIAQLDIDDGRPRDGVLVDQDVPLYSWSRLEPWRWNLAVTLSNHYSVVAWQHRAYRGNKRVLAGLYLCGTQTNTALVRELWSWLTAEAVRLAAGQCRGRGRRRRNSWLEGFAAGVETQLRLAREAAEREAATCGQASAALVLWGDERRRAEEALVAVLGQLDSYAGRSHGRTDPRAYLQGAEMGAALHLGRKLSKDAAYGPGPLQLP